MQAVQNTLLELRMPFFRRKARCHNNIRDIRVIRGAQLRLTGIGHRIQGMWHRFLCNGAASQPASSARGVLACWQSGSLDANSARDL